MIDQNLVRTRRQGCWTLKTSAWGSRWIQVDDPTATQADPPKEFILKDNFPKIPKELWSRIINLYWHYAAQDLEVQVLLLRNLEDPTQWSVVVPEQVVSQASVDSQDFGRACCIVSGEAITEWEPKGWGHSGSSHSHNWMDVSFSGEDDRNELGVPGLHILVKAMHPLKGTYKIDATVVQGKTRYRVDATHVIELKAPDGTLYPTDLRPHPNVFNYVKKERERPLYTPLARRWNQPPAAPPKFNKEEVHKEPLEPHKFDPKDFQPSQFSIDPEEELLGCVEELRFLGYSVEDIVNLILECQQEESVPVNIDWGAKLWNN